MFELIGDARGVMVDVGAHHGNALAPFAAAGWQVYAFEPDRTNRKILAASYGIARNVVIDPRAVSDRAAATATLFRSALSSGISSLSAFHESHVASEQIEVTTLADVCDAWALRAIDFLKIDTEGFDLHVLRGVPWERITPRVIVCEFEDAKTRPLGYAFHDLARELVDHGYRVMVSEWHRIARYGGVHRWRQFSTYPCELVDLDAWGNLIAVREDALFRGVEALCARWNARA